MGLMLYDSTFFVDLDRERKKGIQGAAHAFLAAHPRDEIGISIITLGELARGFDNRSHWEQFFEGMKIFPIERDILWTAAEIFRTLRRQGTPISDNELWIGATALNKSIPVITENASHLGKIPGLTILHHREPKKGTRMVLT
jgi:tRNA(fMet)-specific endonuclease VapC